MKKKVLVLGGTGMLGSMVTNCLARAEQFELIATARSNDMASVCKRRLPEVEWHTFDASSPNTTRERAGLFEQCNWVINCIGVIKPFINDSNAEQVERAIQVNSIFPHTIARLTEGIARVLQIATDCVYSGSKGRYVETDAQDALDVYGKTKSLGEVTAEHMHHLRCSIVGPEMRSPKSLMEWFLGQPQGASVNGFVNHQWNGVTTLHFAKLCRAIIANDLELSHMQHVVPDGAVTKYDMLKEFARRYGRDDLIINATEAPAIIDRTLETTNPGKNQQLWNAAGYPQVPTVPQMIEELATFNYKLKAQLEEDSA
jgi:dTDP-4-dehydrorhamnose reductase